MSKSNKAEALMQAERDSVVAGALFDFVGYLTTMAKPVTMGSKHNCVPALDALEEWAKLRGIDLDRADVKHWGGAR